MVMGLVVWRWGVVASLWGVVAGWGVYRWGKVARGAVPAERTWSKQRVFMLDIED